MAGSRRARGKKPLCTEKFPRKIAIGDQGQTTRGFRPASPQLNLKMPRTSSYPRTVILRPSLPGAETHRPTKVRRT